jgi:hypothetical protein
MKNIVYLIAVFAGLSANGPISDAAAADKDPRMIMPTDIQPESLMAEERNPFERRVELKSEADVADGVELSEEDRVRQRFNVLEVRGGVPGERVLLADMILKKGKLVDPVIMNQTIRLMVTEISFDEVELTWADDVGKKRPRVIVVPYDLAPTVRSRLGGQADTEGDKAPVLAERVMRRNVRPKLPTLRAVGVDGVEREIDTSQIVGQ